MFLKKISQLIQTTNVSGKMFKLFEIFSIFKFYFEIYFLNRMFDSEFWNGKYGPKREGSKSWFSMEDQSFLFNENCSGTHLQGHCGKTVRGRSVGTKIGRSTELGMLFFGKSRKRTILLCACGRPTNGWKNKTLTHVVSFFRKKSIWASQHHFLTTFTLDENAKNKQRSSETWLNPESLQEQKKNNFVQGILAQTIRSWPSEIRGHAKKCVSRRCELADKTPSHLTNAQLHALMTINSNEEKESVGGLSKVSSLNFLKCLSLARVVLLISYCQHTRKIEQYCHVGNIAKQCRLGLFQGSDFAGGLWRLEMRVSRCGSTDARIGFKLGPITFLHSVLQGLGWRVWDQGGVEHCHILVGIYPTLPDSHNFAKRKGKRNIKNKKNRKKSPQMCTLLMPLFSFFFSFAFFLHTCCRQWQCTYILNMLSVSWSWPSVLSQPQMRTLCIGSRKRFTSYCDTQS